MREIARVCAPAAVVFGLLVWRMRFVCDDAFIVFRYSANLARGLGLTYNAGVEPPVEGYTQLGWVLVMSIFEGLGWDPRIWSSATTAACGALLLVWSVVYAMRGLGGRGVAAGGAALFFATFSPAAVWSTGGLGTMPFALAVFAVFERLHGARPRTVQAALAAVAALTLRADGIYFILAIVGSAFLVPRKDGGRSLQRAALAVGATAVVFVVLHVLWRLSYYEDWLPNTVRAKVGLSALSLYRGALYLSTHWLAFPSALLVPLVVVTTALRRPALRPPLALVGATYVYGVLVGGDFMTMGRFFVPAIPFLAALFGVSLERAVERFRGAALVAGVLVAASSVLPAFDRHVLPETLLRRAHFRWGNDYVTEYAMWKGMGERAESWSVLGRALAENTRKGESIVFGAIGAVGYYSGLFIHDQRGLVTREVNEVALPEGLRETPGHERFVRPRFFFPRRPTYLAAQIIPSNAPSPRVPPRGAGERHRLRPEQGFSAGTSLFLVRYVPEDESSP